MVRLRGNRQYVRFQSARCPSSPSYSLFPSKKNPPRPETPARHEALGSKNPFFLLLGEAIHFRREAKVQLRETAGVVGTEIHRDAVPRVRPVRMVLQLLGGERDARHEAEGFGKVGKGERAVELSLRARPAVKGGEPGIGLGSGKFLGACHGYILPRTRIIHRPLIGGRACASEEQSGFSFSPSWVRRSCGWGPAR